MISRSTVTFAKKPCARHTKANGRNGRIGRYALAQLPYSKCMLLRGRIEAAKRTIVKRLDELAFLLWYTRQDSNLRPLGSKPSTLIR